MERASDKRIRLYALQQNKPVGPGILRNYCLKYTSGELLTFHDSDDFSEKNRFEKLIGEMNNRGVDVIASYVQVKFTEAPKDTRIKGYSCATLKTFIDVGRVKAPMHMSSAIISRELFEKMGDSSIISFLQILYLPLNLVIFLELMKMGGITILKDPLFVWNRRSESITMAQRNAKTLRKCMVKQRTLLARELHKMNFSSYVVNESEVKKFVNVQDSLPEDSKVDLKLLFKMK